jgi:hypothetical protein
LKILSDIFRRKTFDSNPDINNIIVEIFSKSLKDTLEYAINVRDHLVFWDLIQIIRENSSGFIESFVQTTISEYFIQKKKIY